MIMKNFSLQGISKAMGLSLSSLELLNITEMLRSEGLVDVLHSTSKEIYIQLSELGENRATQLLNQCNS